MSVQTITEQLTYCITSTYFTWGDKTYEQIHGLPMGSPLSPLLAEVFMADFEERTLGNAPIKPYCWMRKVDDVFSIIPFDQDPTELLNYLNQQNDRIKFTMESGEPNNTLPFLDVKVEMTVNDIELSVYRKPTHTEQYIHHKSNHPTRTKTGIISTLTRGALNVCTEKHLQAELDHLQTVFVKQNGHPLQMVKTVMENTIKKHSTPSRKPVRCETPIFIKLPYSGPISYKIARLLRQQASAEVVFTSNPTIKDYLAASGKKQKADKTKQPKGVVYQVKCSCGKTYIGETKRPLNVRIEEHKASVRKCDEKSAISDHLKINPQHSIDWQGVNKLAIHKTATMERKITEAINIKRHKPEMNRDLGLSLPSAYDCLLF